MGLGTELMRYFAWDNLEIDPDGKTSGRTFREFHTLHAEFPYPAVNHAAAQRLCDSGQLHDLGVQFGLTPLYGSRYASLETTAQLVARLEYGTFDFIVDGLSAVVTHFERSVVQLVGENTHGDPVSGSAFVMIDPHVLVTAAHCVHSISRLRVVAPPSGEIEVTRTDVQNSGDTAVIEIARPIDAKPMMPVDVIQPLCSVVTMGYPDLAGHHPALICSSGEIAGQATNYLEGGEYLVTTCAMTGGSSGGPVVNSEGRVVGVVSKFSQRDDHLDPGRFGLVSPIEPALHPLLTAASKYEHGRQLIDSLL